jgi:glycosyltransferase involved in cell wall biosynthesis
MTRIAMMIPTLDAIGGAERQVMLLAMELAACGQQVSVLSLSGSANASTRELEAAGVSWLSLEMRKAWIDPRGWQRYRIWVAAHQPDIIHTHLPHATWFARCIRLLAPVRVQIDTIHTTHTGSRSRRLIYRITHSLTSQVTCVSAAVARNAETGGLAPRQQLTILPNGVLLKAASPTGIRRESTTFRWLAVGRLARVKDYPTLLRAFATLPAEPSLTIAGAGPEDRPLRQLAAKLGIETRVHFAGFRSDIQPLLADADAFVLSSLWEGLPVSVLEAAAASLPAVVTDGAGTREAILPNETGLIAPVGNPIALAASMSEIMTMTPRQRLEMGSRARRFVDERFSLPAVVDRWQELYSQLLASHSHPSRHG